MNLKTMKRWKLILILLMMLSLWMFIICFPNPFIFVRNIVRYLRFPIDPSIADTVRDEINAEIPDDPVKIEKFTRAFIKYEYDWKNYGFPDYVSTARQTVTRHKGDCEDRAMVLASLLEAKNIPYELKASPIHFWVDYPGKRASKLENYDASYFGKVDGKFRLKLPGLKQWRLVFSSWYGMLWSDMPVYRRVIMILGWAGIAFWSVLVFRRRKQNINYEK